MDKVDLFRYRENTPPTVWAIAEAIAAAMKCSMVSFYRLGNFIC